MDDTTTSAVYAKLFPEQVADKCSAYALEANNGPFAYLHALYQQALSLEALGDQKTQIPLATRRPDIGERVLDEASLETQIPALTLVIEAMTHQAQLHAGATKNLAEEIAKAQYPVQLPFHQPLEQIKAVLHKKGTSLFHVLQQADYGFPNFVYGNLRTDELRNVMRKATGFSPTLQALLLDKTATTETNFLLKRFGVSGVEADALVKLSSVETLGIQTGLKPEEILEMLATSGVADDGKEAFTTVKRSKAYPQAKDAKATPIDGHAYGAVFINNGTAPALSLEDTLVGAGITLRIKGTNADHFGRIHKIIHLQHALQLPFAEVDLLVMSALRAEGQTKDFHFTDNTLRALGVFLHLKEEYRVTAEQYAALINQVSTHSVDDLPALLDQVLDGQGAGRLADISTRLVLDGRAFELPPTESLEKVPTNPVVAELCRAFSVEGSVATEYLSQVLKTLKLDTPTLTLAVFSSFYRLVRLPRLLRLSMSEGTNLIALLNSVNPQTLEQLAGTPGINADKDKPDILDVLMGLVNLNGWIQEQRVSATALRSWLTPVTTQDANATYNVDARVLRTTLDALPRIKSSLLDEAQVAQAVGAGVTPKSGKWLDALSDFVDARGLIKPFSFKAPETLTDKVAEALKDKLQSGNALLRPVVDAREIADVLVPIIDNAVIAQDDAVKHIIGSAFGKTSGGLGLTPEHALPLLRWLNLSRIDLLADVLKAEAPTQVNAQKNSMSNTLWRNLTRHALALKSLKISAAGLAALLEKPIWFDLFEEAPNSDSAAARAPQLNLVLCYQASRYVDWVGVCERNGFEEKDALDFFTDLPAAEESDAVTTAAKRLNRILGWTESETMLALPYTTTTEDQPVQDHYAPLITFDDFVKSLSPADMKTYRYWDTSANKGIGNLFYYHQMQYQPFGDGRAMCLAFDKFIENNPGPLKVRIEHHIPTYAPYWLNNVSSTSNRKEILQFEIYVPEAIGAESVEPDLVEIPCIPSSISDIDYALRLQRLCKALGISCQSVLDFSWINEESTFDECQTCSQILLAACAEDVVSVINDRLQERWRDALAGYLLGYWAVSDDLRKKHVTSLDDLSSYFLTDTLVTSAVKTSAAIHHTASLQHYLHKVFARLEPGYLNTNIPDQLSTAWRQYFCEYGLWKIWRTQLNHPENLIYYANRPNKSAAFKTLEVELNQGKLDPELLQTAITSYLTKFEQTSNLQIVSGYLDGIDPKNDTYHFIGKTHASPAEYYWRSVDMGLRDNEQRLSPLAWTEWEKIAVAPTGQITQSSYTETKADNTKTKYTCDTIRPVMIEGRPYVFWVERGTLGLPSSDIRDQTPTKYRKLSVQYIYKQSDGFWSPPNELMCLDGTKEGVRLDDMVVDESSTSEPKTKVVNPYLKDDTYEPGLIALVNLEGQQAQDPWLTVMLYNCSGPSLGKIDSDYFIQSRDLLLIDKKEIAGPTAIKLAKVIYNSYKDVTKLQHPYNGDTVSMLAKNSTPNESKYELEIYTPNTFSTPHLPSKTAIEVFKRLADGWSTTTIIEASKPFIGLYFKSPIAYMDKKLDPKRNDKYTLMEKEMYLEEMETRLKYYNDRAAGKLKICYFNDLTTHASHPDYSDFHVSNLSSPGSIFLDVKKPPQTIQIKALYPKCIIKKSNVKWLRVKNITQDVGVGSLRYVVTCSAQDQTLVPEGKITLVIQISGAGVDIPNVGYSVTVAGKSFVKSPVPAIPEINNIQLWTCSLDVEKATFLLEDSFRITISSGGSSIASLPAEAGITSEHCEPILLRLYVKAPNQTSFVKLTEESVTADGKAVINQDYDWTNPGLYLFALCEAGNPMQNVFVTYDIRTTGTDEKWDISIRRNTEQAQYLDLSSVAGQLPTLSSDAIRLNTLFGKQLVSRAARSVVRALEWDAQMLKEPEIDSKDPNPSVDFHGANGGYFRELFLHLPTLVATRLSEQQQFDEAEQWINQYLFDPYRTLQDEKQRPPFWNNRPLSKVGSGKSELQKAVNPTARAFIQSRYYRQAVFLTLVENWQRQGDHFYRQLTPSTLNQAWLSYQKALKLIGPLPERTTVSRWAPAALKSLAEGAFRTPINERVIDTRKTIENRLYNLRHGLTLDGKLLPIMDWRDEGADPFGFAQRGIGHQISTYNSNRTQIPACRFRQLIPMARAAVQQLQDMGRHYMALMEEEFNTTLSVLLKQQEIRMSDFTLKLQQEAISSVKAKRETLQLSRTAAGVRYEWYGALINVGKSLRERVAGMLQMSASMTMAAIAPISMSESAAKMTPRIAGTAFGGQDNSGLIGGARAALEFAANITQANAEQMLIESGYERRAQEWKFEVAQAVMDMHAIDLQLKETNIELNAATIAMEEARAHRKNLEEAHLAMTTGFTIIPVYNWLVARQELLYAPAYDAVLSLCLSAEAAWRYEIGDYKRHAFVKTSAWIDSYKGMLAGESLLVDLQEMENAYLQSNERRLTIKKTINVWEAKADAKADAKALKDLKTTPLTFSIKSADFDKSYPGHYLRQLKHVSVSFVMAADAGDTMKEVSAILTQTDSTTLVEPTEEGLEYLYYAGTKLPLSLKRNLRAQQQIALSSSAADDGLGFGPGDWVYELMFHDGRYLPFEGTGAISGWQLSFPDESFVDSLVKDGKPQVKSIQLHLVYTAVDGGKDFTDKVKTLRDKPQPK